MTREDERLMILDMLERGKVTSDEADKLLASLNPSGSGSEPEMTVDKPIEKSHRAHWIRIRVTELSSGKKKFSMTLPLFFMRLGIRFGKHFTGDSLDSNTFEVGKEFFRKPVKGRVVDASDPEDDEHVEISFL